MSSNIDKSGNIIYLTGEVNSEMYAVASRGISDMQNSDYITVVLNTEGGEVYQALAIYDFIKASKVPVKILCSGPVMSAGTIILCASDERVSLENTQFMIHYGQESNDSPSVSKHNKYLFNLIKAILKEKVNVSSKTLASWFVKDTFLNAEEALKVGLITRISK